MNFVVEKIKIAGAVVVAGSTTLASAYSQMDVNLAVPLNTLIMAAVGLFIRWVEKKIFKEKIEQQVKQEMNTPETHDRSAEQQL